MKRKATHPRYKYDLWVRFGVSVIAAYIASQYGGDEGFLKLIFTKAFYPEYLTTLVITILVVHMIFFSTRLLDRYVEWHHRPLWRVPLQILLGIIIPNLVAFILAACYFAYYNRDIFQYDYHLQNLQFNTLLIILFNLYYYIRYLLGELSRLYKLHAQPIPLTAPAFQITTGDIAEARPQEAPAAARTTIIVHTPIDSITVPVSGIAYFYRVDNRVYLQPFSGNAQILSQSLDALEEQLDGGQFFRAARHMIVNRAAVKAFKPLLHGKLALSLEPQFKGKATVGKSSASKFRSWIGR